MKRSQGDNRIVRRDAKARQRANFFVQHYKSLGCLLACVPVALAIGSIDAAAAPGSLRVAGSPLSALAAHAVMASTPVADTPDAPASIDRIAEPRRAVENVALAMVDDQDAAAADLDDRGDDQPAAADNGQNGDTVVHSIYIDQDSTQRITVSRNGTAVINLNRNVDSVDIADKSVADVYLTSPTRIVLTGKAFGTTQLLLHSGTEQRVFHVDCELDLSLLRSFIRSVSPSAKVDVRSVNGIIFLNGMVPDSEIADQITQMASLVQRGEVRANLTVAGVQQTLLRVVVAEVNKIATRQLGVNWALGASKLSRDFFFAQNVANLNPTVFGSNGLPNVLNGQLLYSVAPVANGPATNITFGFPRAELQTFVNALRENGLARTLAEPNLVAISGQTATFLAGGEVPIPVAQAGASAGAITVEYREFGVRLGFTPTVLGGQLIRLHVMTEVSDAIPTDTVAGGFPLFTFNTRRVESTIECGNGQTFAIAGLLNDVMRANASKIPALGDLPVLGTLFSNTSYERDTTELVVLVTPQLVEPLDPQQVPPPPGSLMTEPNDWQLYYNQKLEGDPKPRPMTDAVPRDHYPSKCMPASVAGWAANHFAVQGPWGLAEYEEN